MYEASIIRTEYTQVPPKVEYNLTETGLFLMPVLQALCNWGHEHIELKYSNYSYLEISNYLAFSSHNHFAKVFKEHTGYSPKDYRTKFFRHNFH